MNPSSNEEPPKPPPKPPLSDVEKQRLQLASNAQVLAEAIAVAGITIANALMSVAKSIDGASENVEKAGKWITDAIDRSA